MAHKILPKWFVIHVWRTYTCYVSCVPSFVCSITPIFRKPKYHCTSLLVMCFCLQTITRLVPIVKQQTMTENNLSAMAHSSSSFAWLTVQVIKWSIVNSKFCCLAISTVALGELQPKPTTKFILHWYYSWAHTSWDMECPSPLLNCQCMYNS